MRGRRRELIFDGGRADVRRRCAGGILPAADPAAEAVERMTEPSILNPLAVADLQADLVARWKRSLDSGPEAEGFLAVVAEQHRANFDLWNREDQARRRDVADSVIAEVKRAIDGLNQRRNDLVETMDDMLLSELSRRRIVPGPGAEQFSETPGSMIDRLSILALKVYHMNLQAERTDAGAEHVAKCAGKRDVLIEQRGDLTACLSRLLVRIESGAAVLKVYRQFKMYNDPNLNPALYDRG